MGLASTWDRTYVKIRKAVYTNMLLNIAKRYHPLKFKMKLAYTAITTNLKNGVRFKNSHFTTHEATSVPQFNHWEAVQELELLSSTSAIKIMGPNSYALIAGVCCVKVISKDPIYCKWRQVKPICLLHWAEYVMAVPYLLCSQSVAIKAEREGRQQILSDEVL